MMIGVDGGVRAVPLGVGRERAVGHTLDEETGVVYRGTQKFSVRQDARGGKRRRTDTNIGTGKTGLDCGAHN